MAEYDSAIALAKRLIEKKGRRDGKLLRASQAAPAGKPWAPGTAGKVALAENLAVAILGASLYKAGSLTPETTAVGYLAAASFGDVRLGDVLETRAERYSILAAEKLAPGEQDILYILHLKG